MQQLAERPDDSALRLVFSDWLQERGDPRGEVIALCARGMLSLTERRRVARLTTQHGPSWLGPLAPWVDLQRTRFDGGFVSELVFSAKPCPFASWVDEARLWSVRRLAIPAVHPPRVLTEFLTSRWLRGVQTLELGSGDWAALKGASLGDFKPNRVGVSSWGVFDDELTGLRAVDAFAKAQILSLSTTEFVNTLVVADVMNALRSQLAALEGFRGIQLTSRYGVLEGSAAWLLAAEPFRRSLPALESWGVESSELAITRSVDSSGALSQLVIDLSLPEAPGEKQAPREGKTTTEVRLATAASVLVLLGPARLTRVEVRVTPGTRLRAHERNTLLVAARRSASLEHFEVVGEPVSP